MNLYDNSDIDCNKKINYMICVIISFLINSFIVKKYKNNFLFSNYKRV